MFKHFLKRALNVILPKASIIWCGPTLSDTIYLTFDDGPYPAYTNRIIEALAAHGARATFFLLGKSIPENSSLVKKAIFLGYGIGNHTFSHYLGSHLCLHTFDEINKTDLAITTLTGQHVKVLRPPYGKITLPFLLYSIINRYSIVMWSYDSNDSFIKHDAKLLQGLDKVRGGDILLFHDDTEITARNIDAILVALKRKGFRFGLIQELLPNHQSSVEKRT